MHSPCDELARLERRIRRRLDLRMAANRVVGSAPAILQIVLAAAASYSVARWALGHATPLLAVTVVITALGLSRDARPRRLAETIMGMLLGILFADVLVLAMGKGLPQLVVVLLTTLIVARAASRNPSFAIAAAVQSALVVLLPPPVGGPLSRTLDALVASAFALLVTALVPRDTRREAVRDGRALFGVLTESTSSIAEALRSADPGAAELALGRLRRTQPLIDAWTESLDGAIAVSRIAPVLRRFLPQLRGQRRVLRGGDLAARHLRIIGRRVEFLVRDGEPRPALGESVGEIARSIGLIADELRDPQIVGAARSILGDLARRMDPAVMLPGAGVADTTVLVQLRPLVVDLLAATGLEEDVARALLPPL
ncbi:MAG: FUSC family protein [Micrococcales bacterium]|nr:FUSC family protein [Micrococcales bacterium]